MLPPGSYRIKIINYCNPHLIWADKDNVLEQIGIYGIVPNAKTLAFNLETNSYCFLEFDVDKWLPATRNLMKEFFAKATEIWFSVIHLDDGCIFDGKHKYGDIYGKTKSGLQNLSTFLTQSSFGTIDKRVFHEKLSQKLYTKLNYTDMIDIIRNLNAYYNKITNKFQLYEKDLSLNKGDVLEEVNWKFEEKGTDKDYAMKTFLRKMDEKPKNMRMLKKLEMLKMLKKNVTETDISSAKEDKELNVDIKEEIKKDSVNVRPTRNNQFKLLESEKASKMENNGDDDINDLMQYINTKYPKRNIKMCKNEIEDDKIDLNTITSSMCSFVENVVKPVVMVHSKLKKNIKPIFTMRDIPFNEHIHIVLKNMSIAQPMMIQSITWHTILRGHSIFIIGPKFCGKTIGYLPSVCRLVSDGTPEMSNCLGPICIIVCATAESVTQMEENAKMLLGLKERILAVFPGVDDFFINTTLLNGCDLIISTPSVLVRLLQDYGVDLRRLEIIVLDDCERMVEVYRRELKYFLYKIKELERSRSNKELKVQFVVASRIWCDFMEPLAKKVPDAVISIGAFPECVIYSKAKMTVSFVKGDKIGSVLEFLDEIDASKKVVIVCRLDDEVKILEKGLKGRQHCIFACNNEMTPSDLHNLNSSWNDCGAPSISPILICTDENLSHLNITDANYLVHYSLPKEYFLFRKRFFVLNDKFPSIFHSNNESVKIKIILDEVNTEKLPKILNFVKRFTKDMPPVLDEICNKVLAEKDLMKAETLVPICGNLLTLGYCPEFYDCRNRHAVLKGFDDPPNWVPRHGIVTFKIIHLHTAVNYSARLLTHIDNNKVTKFPAMHTLAIKIGLYYGNVANRQLHGVPKVGDVCAVSVKLDSFARCQVVKIICRTRGSYKVLVKLLDEEKYEETRDIYLYHLPQSLISIETYIVQIRLVNLQPKDNDVTFSALALGNIKSLVDDEASYVRGHIAGVIGNCLFLDTLEVCEYLRSLNQVIMKHDLKQELLQIHAEEYPEHINKIKELCGSNFPMVSTPAMNNTKEKNTGTWAHLNIGELEGVFITSVINPEQCLVRVSKFEPCMQALLKDIETYIDSNPDPLLDAEVGDIILAKFPNDDIYERARVDKIEGNMINCFFVDQGDSAYVPLKDAIPITDTLINKLSFQSIECRLIGVKPAGYVWTDFCNTWLSNYADEGTKYFFAKPFNKQPAITTGGYKYSIALVDTSSSADIIINQVMLDLNIASPLEDEIDYLKDVVPNTGTPEDWERLDIATPDIPDSSSMPKLIRSVPLIASDSDSNQSDPWEMYNLTDFTSHLKQPQKTKQGEHNLPAIKPLADNGNTFISTDRTSSIDLSVSISNDLVSDDTASSTKPQCAILDETRQPKLLWRQDKAFVHIKIQLIGVEEYEMTINERSLKFSTLLHETMYAFDFELYGVVDACKSSHSNKGQYIMAKLVKVLHKNWSTLGNFEGIKRWIVYDVDHLHASSDEEAVDDSVVEIAKELHESEDTDSDGDLEFIYN